MEKDLMISLSRESFKKIKEEVNLLQAICSDEVVKKRLANLLDFIESVAGEKNSSLEEMIGDKLEETKNTNKALNADLYILYQNLKRGRISEETAKNMFENFLRIEKYDRGVYLK